MFCLSSPHLVPLFLLPAFAYNITTKLNQNDRPAPGRVMFANIEFQPDEPSGVDMLLFNGSLGNTTAVLTNLVLTNNNNLGFTIPFVPPGTAYAIRLVENQGQGFLQDSPPFQIFAVGSSDVSTSRLPPSTSASSLVSSPDSITSFSGPNTLSTVRVSSSGPSTPSTARVSSPLSLPTSTPTSSSLSFPTTIGKGKTGSTSKIRPIVGGTIGGVLGVAIIAIILLRLCFRNKPPTNRIVNPFPIAGQTPDAQLLEGSVQPFVLNPNHIAGAKVLSNKSFNQLGPLHKKLTHRVPPRMESLPLADAGCPPNSSNNAPARADFLQPERERINTEIALLEDRSLSGTGLPDSPPIVRVPPVPIDTNIADQLARLREEIRQIEVRQLHGPTVLLVGGSDDGLPPSYDGLSTTSIRA